MHQRIINLFFAFFAFKAVCQTDSLNNEHYKEKYQLTISKSASPIKIDGMLDEPAWQSAKAADDFWNKFPNNVGKPKRKSSVKALFSDDYLYFSAYLEDTSTYVIQSLKRDVDLWGSDNFIVAIDPMNAKTNGFVFSVNPYNVQAEDVFGNNSFDQLTFSWDNKWLSATKRYADHWVVEMAIPFKTLRYSPTKDTWGVNFIRCDLKNFQFSTWVHMPTQFPGYDPGWMGALKWQELPQSAGRNVSIIPFLTSSAIKEDGLNTKASGGLDAKVALSPSLNLDLTLNPDFSQIEVDQQVTNLTRFNIFLPERRTFFLENADLFSNYGFPDAKPFYSRSIGLDKDGRSIPIIGGFRVSGNANKLLRVGVMNMQTGGRGQTGTEGYQSAQNYTAASFNQTVGSRSVVKGYFLNKQATGPNLSNENPIDKFGRNAGLELGFTDNSGKYGAWANIHHSIKPTIKNQNNFGEVGFNYAGNNFSFITDYTNIGKNYYTDMGYVSQIETATVKGASYDDGFDQVRMGFDQLFNEASYTIRPTKGIFNKHEVGIGDFRVRRQNQWTDKYTELGYEMGFKNSSELSLGYALNQTVLLFYTPLPDIKPLTPGEYRYGSFSAEYESDARKLFYFSLSCMKGGFYSGQISQLASKITARAQPWGNFSLSYEFNDLTFGAYGNARFNLLNARTEINFSNNIFWTTFLQYNTQRNNFNINSRFQWRYKPMSDLFVVFTDNYLVDPNLKNRDRAIILKLNYWLTI